MQFSALTSCFLIIFILELQTTMIPTARCMAAKPSGFLKRSAEELGRVSRIGTSPSPIRPSPVR
jgi:hypothetical protein